MPKERRRHSRNCVTAWLMMHWLCYLPSSFAAKGPLQGLSIHSLFHIEPALGGALTGSERPFGGKLTDGVRLARLALERVLLSFVFVVRVMGSARAGRGPLHVPAKICQRCTTADGLPRTYSTWSANCFSSMLLSVSTVCLISRTLHHRVVSLAW